MHTDLVTVFSTVSPEQREHKTQTPRIRGEPGCLCSLLIRLLLLVEFKQVRISPVDEF
jgi:hypothetical protein